MTHILLSNLAIVACINFLAAFLQASIGFGYAMLAMSLMPLILPMRICSAVSAGVVVTIGIQMVVMLRKHLDFRVCVVPVLFCILFTNVGMYFLMHWPERVLRFFLAALLLLLTAMSYLFEKKGIVLKMTWLNSILAGAVTGISTGMFNIVGPFFMIYYFNICKNNLCFKASMEFSFLAAGLYSLLLHAIYGNINAQAAPYLIASSVAAFAAGFAGIRLFKRLNRKLMCRLIYLVLPVMAFCLQKK